MLSDASLYSQYHNMQARDTRRLLDTVFPLMDWSAQSEDVVMDVGCGPGNTTRDVLLPAFPDVKAVVGLDVLPKMVEFARKQSGHPKISYHVASIEDRSTLVRWRKEISKVVSIYCFNWVKDHETSFENVLDLLKPGGEAVILFASSTPFWDSYEELVINPKWNIFLQDVDRHIPECHSMENRSDHYRKMLERIGFTVVFCEDEKRTFAYQNDAECKVACTSRSALSKHIPDHLMEEFTEDIFHSFIKYNGRSEDGRPELQYTTLTLLLKKQSPNRLV